MNDASIRDSFHKKALSKYHKSPDALVLDELGLKHGKCRADIAVINGKLSGYEIKSNEDTFVRLHDQVSAYNSVFDNATIIIGEKHKDKVNSYVPKWWGIIEARRLKNGTISFRTIRRPLRNPNIDPFSVAQLLWRAEAISILMELGHPKSKLSRCRREDLYNNLTETLSLRKLRNHVTHFLKSRKAWRLDSPQIRYGD
jgi:hypothetical protein